MIDTRSAAPRRRSAPAPAVAVPPPVLLTPLRIETAAVHLGTRRSPDHRVERIGMGPARAEVARARLARSLAPGTPLAVVGVGGGLSSRDRAGDIVVASDVRLADGTRPPMPLDAALAERLREALSRSVTRRVRVGPVACTPALLSARETASLPGTAGALACEMESVWLAPLAGRHPLTVVRVIVDRPGRGLVGPWTMSAGLAALRRLAAAAPVVVDVLGSLGNPMN
jgi:4-hydroxy-3-methylbut-2-enyl diphosphate reductase